MTSVSHTAFKTTRFSRQVIVNDVVSNIYSNGNKPAGIFSTEPLVNPNSRVTHFRDGRDCYVPRDFVLFLPRDYLVPTISIPTAWPKVSNESFLRNFLRLVLQVTKKNIGRRAGTLVNSITRVKETYVKFHQNSMLERLTMKFRCSILRFRVRIG